MKQSLSLVTGGAGFIGSHVTDHLLQMGHQVVVLDDLSGGFRENINPKAQFVQGSVSNTKLINSLFKRYQFDFVFHLAAYAAEGLSHFIRHFNYENNLLGSINLINAAVVNNVKQFVFTSSIAVYGGCQPPLRENQIPTPVDPYGIAKYSVELDLKAAHEMFGLNYTIFRPHNVYGERQNHGDPYRNVLGIFINNLLLGKAMTIFGDGLQTRAFSYIDDVAPFIAKSVAIKEAQNQIFNLGADKAYTVLELAHSIANAFGVEPKITFLPPRYEVKEAYSDHAKIKKVFKIASSTPLSVGVTRMVEWAKKVGPRHPKKFGKLDIESNLPPSWAKLR